MAHDGYPVGVTIASVMPLPERRAEYAALLSDIAETVRPVTDVDLTVELITHRFHGGKPHSAAFLVSGHAAQPGRLKTSGEALEAGWQEICIPGPVMREMHPSSTMNSSQLGRARVLYWT